LYGTTLVTPGNRREDAVDRLLVRPVVRSVLFPVAIKFCLAWQSDGSNQIVVWFKGTCDAPANYSQLLAPVAKLILEFLHICLIQFRDNQIVEAPLIPTTEAVPLLGLNIEIDRMTRHGPYEYIDKAALALCWD
jgi:hypothetical protein